jgi:hypothetical protein
MERLPRALARDSAKDHQRPGTSGGVPKWEARVPPILQEDLVAVAVRLKEPYRVLNLVGGLTMSRLKSFPLSK